jgi:hypothetical protein
MKIFEVIATKVTADQVYDTVKHIHRNYDDFHEGDLTDRIYWFAAYKLTELSINDLDLDEWDVDEDLVAEHVAMIMKSRHTTPPIVYDPKERSIIDGIHRANAYAQLGYETIPAYVGVKKSRTYGKRSSDF